MIKTFVLVLAVAALLVGLLLAVDTPLLTPDQQQAATHLRFNKAVLAVIVPAVDPNGVLIRINRYEVSVDDPAFSQVIRNALIDDAKDVVRAAGKIQ